MTLIDSKLTEVIRWNTELSPALVNKLLSVAQLKTQLKPSEMDGSAIAHQGASFILEGTVAIGMQTPSLKTVNNIVMGKGDWFGNYDNQNTGCTPFFITEIDNVKLIHFSNFDLHRLAQDNIEIYKWFHALSFEAKAKWLQSQLMMSEVKGRRIVYLLIELAAHIPSVLGEIPQLKISQQQISEITGIARQRVNEAIKQLEMEKLVELKRNCIYLTDLTGLGHKLDSVDLSIRDPRLLISH
ncbi:putative transcriptional regulator, Crp/Fnr family [Shewanella halifaxensis HAW-EB4]|uniref:Transcriptional regulator, Crp/Fnr family n=1 Tax=Shewanella halifaxensis (strain HAW-EB4) TaxID=458817 RepID=B0TSH7_SHEHH|nr:putative transcriptional regulator, Crp/Fnr family [Shewanella halifaxensis HAW-EB4]